MTEKKENFFKKAFKDMKESAKVQHEVNKANFEAVKAESKAQWEEAKMNLSQKTAMMREEQLAQIEEANERKKLAEERIAAAKKLKNN